MTVVSLLEAIDIGVEWWIVIIICILSLIQIVPIKINPLSWIARLLGRAINRELYDKVTMLENKIDDMAKEQTKESAAREEDKAISARIRILRFNDELLSHKMHSKESFDQTLDDITFYEDYCEDHKHFKNDRAVMAIKNVKRCYDKCCIDNDFL